MYSERPVNFLLFLTAFILILLFGPIGFLVTIVVAFSRISFTKVTGYLSQLALALALIIDILGNVLCRDLMNWLLKKPGGYEFGYYRETISRVLGKNKALGTLTPAGVWLASLLNSIEENHVEMAAAD